MNQNEARREALGANPATCPGVRENGDIREVVEHTEPTRHVAPVLGRPLDIALDVVAIVND